MSRFDGPIDVIVLSETWFSESSCCSIEGYIAYHVYRENRVGGGVSIYVRKGLISNYIRDKSLTSDFCESCVVEISPDNRDVKQNLIIFALYRSPNSSVSEFVNHVDLVAREYFNKAVLYVGDLNVDVINEDSSSELVNVMFSHYLYPLISVPTRVTGNSATCIDHMWYNRHNVSHSGAFVTDFSDHYLIFCVLNISIDRSPLKKVFRNHSQSNLNLLNTHLSLLYNSYFEVTGLFNVNEKSDYFLDGLWDAYNESCPLKIKSISYKSILRPWITKSIISQINYKHLLFKRFKESIIPFHVYNEFKNSLKSKLKSAKLLFYKDKFKLFKNNAKENWKTVNSLLGNKKNSASCSMMTDINGDDVTDPTRIANLFCDHFSTVATSLNNNIPTMNDDPLNYMPNPTVNSFYVLPATTDEVIKVVLSMENKTIRTDSVPFFVYRSYVHLVAPIIEDIFNSSVTEGVFPDALKTARTIPIFKSKNPKLVSNFRPISILHVMSKILEKLMKTRVDSYLKKEKIIYDKQYGFRSGCNTSDAVVEVVDKCVNGLDSGLFTIVVCLDLSKAFDTVNKNILISKMENMGFRGVVRDWFESYLSNRRMYVEIEGRKSLVKSLNIGLPQGSVSSPYLFSLYINEMKNSSNKLDFTHFADDTTVFMSGSSVESLCSNMNLELDKVSRWLKVNRLSLNIEKTQFMLITHCNTVDVPISVAIDGIELHKTDCVKFLGIYMD